MELILHFSVHCANIRVFGETTKFFGGVFDSCSNLPQIKVYHQYCVPTILQVVTPFLSFGKSYILFLIAVSLCTCHCSNPSVQWSLHPFISPVCGGQKPFSQRELHILTKPSLLRKEGCNRPPVLRTAWPPNSSSWRRSWRWRRSR